MSKIDFKKELKDLYQPRQQFELRTVPPLQYLMIDGHGNPGTAPAYAQALAALYALAYKLKFMSKSELGRDFVVPPLSGLWWADDMNVFASGDKDAWDWTMMIMQPDWITPGLFSAAREQVAAAKDLPALPLMRLETYDEGLCVQILHIGSYADEAPTLRRLHAEYLPQNGLVEAGKHHEIYLSDPRRVAAARLRTILRQPVAYAKIPA